MSLRLRLTGVVAFLLVCSVFGTAAIGGAGASGGTVVSSDAPTTHQSSQFAAEETVTQDEINVTTSYPTESDSQAIAVSITIQPENDRITNISLAIRNTDSAFIDFDSFTETIEPSGATEVSDSTEYRNEELVQTFEIDSLDVGQSVTITFRAYPRTLQANGQSIDAATIEYQYLRQGIEVPGNSPGEIDATTDISESPHYQLQSAETRANGLWGVAGAGVIIGLIGLVAGGFLFFKSKQQGGSGIERSQVRDIKDDISDLSAKLRARVDDEDIQSDLKDILDDLDDLL